MEILVTKKPIKIGLRTAACLDVKLQIYSIEGEKTFNYSTLFKTMSIRFSIFIQMTKFVMLIHQ